MAQDLYTNDESPLAKKHEGKKNDANTELVSKSFLHMDEDEEAEKGKECTIRVVKDWGDEVEVEYVKKKDKSKDRDSDEDETEMSADDELDAIEAGSMKGGY